MSSSQRRPSSVETLLSGVPNSQASQSVLSLRKMFLINCLSAMQEPLKTHSVADASVRSLGLRIEANIAALAESELAVILERCGLQKKVTYIKDRIRKSKLGEIVPNEEDFDDGKPMVEADGMSVSAVSESLKLLFGLLLGGNEGAIPEFEQIRVPRFRSESCGRVARAVAEAYEIVYNAVSDPASGYLDAKSMLRHSPEQMKTILGL